ncbi:HlyD family type I secretion periplasmic adaptor subunit [Anaplasmataceae bacterium AB001_6]|nr:HlyD family type I secretion periplasmic adaptor subunit [Anaplasmataceae bacterium AB001_6]
MNNSCDLTIPIQQKSANKDLIELKNYFHRPRYIGLMAIFVFFGIFGSWASFAPLDGNVMAPGVIIPVSRKQVVQHREGGTIKDIMVRNGEKVNKDQPLIELYKTHDKTDLRNLNETLVYLLATKDALNAQYVDNEDLEFTQEIYDIIANNDLSSDVLAARKISFHSHKNWLANQKAIMLNHVNQLNSKIKSLEIKRKASANNLVLMQKQFNRKKTLLEQGFLSSSEFEKAESQKINIEQELKELDNSLTILENQIQEKELEIQQLIMNDKNKLSSELTDILKKIQDVTNQISKTQCTIDSAIIKSPSDGIVSGLEYNNIGGVIPPGSPVMEIVPNDDNMMIEAHISPQNMEEILVALGNKKAHIKAGEISGVPVKIRFTAFNSRKLGMVTGILTYVSANAQPSSDGNPPYYSAHIMIPKEAKANVERIAPLHPGVPVVAFIKYTSRTLLDYLLSPLTSSIQKAVNEK